MYLIPKEKLITLRDSAVQGLRHLVEPTRSAVQVLAPDHLELTLDPRQLFAGDAHTVAPTATDWRTKKLDWLAQRAPFDANSPTPPSLLRLDANATPRARDWRSAAQFGPADLQASPEIQDWIPTFMSPFEREMTNTIQTLTGYQVQGGVKSADRIVDKLQHRGLSLGQLDDLARGRIDLPKVEREDLVRILQQLRDGLEPHGYTIEVHYDGTLPPSKAERQYYGGYHGRVHFWIKDALGVPYELQVGPRSLSQFFETSFRLPGVPRETSMHNAVYKGVQRLVNNDEAAAILGGGDAKVGKQYLLDTVAMYDRIMSNAADQNEKFDFDRETGPLRERLGAIFNAMKPYPQLQPAGIRMANS